MLYHVLCFHFLVRGSLGCCSIPPTFSATPPWHHSGGVYLCTLSRIPQRPEANYVIIDVAAKVTASHRISFWMIPWIMGLKRTPDVCHLPADSVMISGVTLEFLDWYVPPYV